MAEENYIEKFLGRMYPKHGELQVDDDGGIFTIILDAEMDSYVCKFNYDGCVEIDTDEYTHISLDVNTLRHLAELVEEADEIYENRTDEEWESFRAKANLKES